MRYAVCLVMVFVYVTGLTLASDAPANLVKDRSDLLVKQSLDKVVKFANDNGIVKAWVFFTDKGFSSDLEYSQKLNETELNLTEKARTRRLKARDRYNIVDFHDIPVYQPYIEQLEATGLKIRRVLKWFNAVTVEADVTQLDKVAAMPFVYRFKQVVSRKLSDDNIREVQGERELPLISSTLDYGDSQMQLEQINTVVAHELGIAGEDVLICMMDTGYRQSHVAFENIINEGRLIIQYDFINNDNDTDFDENQDAENQPRHGTLTWSTLGGESSGNLYGPSYKANFVLAKTEDVTSEHHSEEDNWAAAAEWCDSLGVDVISASLGYRYSFDPPDEEYPYEWMNGDSAIVSIAADLAAARGITVATAQGNDGDEVGSLIAPADADSVIAVGAVLDSDSIASFSGVGPTYDGRVKPEICALGVGTACADPEDMNSFSFASGTSLSTPLVGGACGILLSAHPNWTPMMVREALMMTATQSSNEDNYYGWGIIDVGKALFYHPENDLVIEHSPLIYFPPGLDNNAVYAEISGGAGVQAAYVRYRVDESAEFESNQMNSGGDDMYEGVIPGLDEGYLQYYIEVIDNNGIEITYPYNAPDKYFTVYIDSTAFYDSFENGLYYWTTEGTNGGWSLTAERANTGNISVTDSPYRDYLDNTEITLTSNFEIDLYDADSASVSFMTRHIIQSDEDFVYFEISDDGGENWNLLGAVISGTEVSFEEISVDLNDYLGESIIFRFRMSTNGSDVRDGIHIDDFQVVWENQTGIDDDNNQQLPGSFSLSQNYPNPFNPSTILHFEIPQTAEVELIVYDILGKKVQTLINGTLDAGSHEITWNGKDDSGNDVASGMYFYKLTAGDYSELKRMTLIR